MDPILDSPSALRIAERQVGDVTVLALSGALLVEDGDRALRDRIHQLIAAGRVNLLLDLGGLTTVDSAGFGMIIAKLNTVRAAGGDLKLVHLTHRTLRLLSTMKVLSVFQTFDDEDAAVRSRWIHKSTP
jgi:anti-sigma B factor antagonist